MNKENIECKSCGAILNKNEQVCRYCGNANPQFSNISAKINSVFPNQTSNTQSNTNYNSKSNVSSDFNVIIFILLMVFCGPFGLIYLFYYLIKK